MAAHRIADPTADSTLHARLPAVHRLLSEAEIVHATEVYGCRAIRVSIDRRLREIRRLVDEGELDGDGLDRLLAGLPEAIAADAAILSSDGYPEAINATGVLLHTNLGRAPIEPVTTSRACFLELDESTGRRGRRSGAIEAKLAALLGVEASVVVNNNASALWLLLAPYSGQRIAVSRGELVEIGGSFRLPEILEAAGVELVEVGCTNRTHLEDYAGVIDEVAAVLVANPSNYRIEGFSTKPQVRDLAKLSHDNGRPLLVDQGCGTLWPLERWGLENEATVSGLLADGADAVCFSGDKLLCGPQAGVIVGSADLVGPLATHPLMRALRLDKLRLAALDRCLAAHLAEDLERLELYRQLSASIEQLEQRAERIAAELPARLGVTIVGSQACVGGGTTPGQTIESVALAIAPSHAETLRRSRPGIVGRVHEGRLLLDLRSIAPRDDERLLKTLLNL